ncbi:MAG: lipopolysaccharide heptosyltransferase I [Pseudomonadales bacterium]|nr:lipopolysaccharide heptosyltransferase I [Pseudomonadales bacterium]
MRVLLVKMSSLGDVVHALPAVTDAARHGIRFDWVVEEAFAAIPALHPAVDQVVPIAWRRWRRSLGSERAALADFFARLRATRYDLVLDAQGLAKSAAVTRAARARARAGFGFGSAREGIAALAYGRRVAVPRDRHAIDRLRMLFAGVFDYAAPAAGDPIDYGVRVGTSLTRRCVLLHGTTWASKHWPDVFWKALAQQGHAAGYEIALPAGNAAETARANAIAGPIGGMVWSGMGLAELIPLLGESALAIGVDSGLTHLAAALDVPTLALYGSTDSALTGCRGRRARSVQAEFPCVPCRARECAYRGPAQAWSGITVEPACYASLPPERVWAWARELAAPGRP